MLNLIVSFDDPMERLLYGEPDPGLALFECRHDVGYQHHHNTVNPPTGPGGPEPEPEPEPEGPDSTPQPDPEPDPDPPGSEPSPAQIAEWQDRHETGEQSYSLAESVWRAQQAGREVEARQSDNPAVARVEQSGVERQLRQEEIDRERFAPSPEYDVDEGLRQLHDLTDRAPGDTDAEWYDRLIELYETYADAWEAAGLLDTRLTDGQGNTFTLGEYLADQRSRLAVRQTLGDIDHITAALDPGDVAALQAIADDPAQASLPITVTGADGQPAQTTVGDYIENVLIPQVQERLAVRDTLGGIDDITDDLATGDVAALQAIADDPAQASLPITVTGADGQPTQTTVGDYIENVLIPQVQERLAVRDTLGGIDDITDDLATGDVAALQAIADDPDKASLPITVTGADGQPTQTTVGDYIENVLIPQVQERLAVRDTLGGIDDITDDLATGDVAALQAIADDPDKASLPITVTGADGQPTQTTVGDYIKDVLIPQVQEQMGIPRELLDLAAASGIDATGVTVVHPKPGSGWGVIGTVYVLPDGTVLGTGNADGGFSARRTTVDNALMTLIPELEGVTVFHPTPGSGWGGITTVYLSADGTVLATGDEDGGFRVRDAGRDAVASSLGFDAAPSLNGSRPEVAASGPAPMATDSGDWSYLEGRNIWIYDPAGEAPQRPPAALPRGAEPGGQWTYHEDREYWYYEPPAAAAGVGGGAQAEATDVGATGSPRPADDTLDAAEVAANTALDAWVAAGQPASGPEFDALVSAQDAFVAAQAAAPGSATSGVGIPAADADAGGAQIQASGSAGVPTEGPMLGDTVGESAAATIPPGLLDLAAASGIDATGVTVVHPKPGSGWGAIGTVYVLPDGTVLGTGNADGGFSARRTTVDNALMTLIPELEGVTVFHPTPGSGWGGITTVYLSADGTVLATGDEDGGFRVRDAGRDAVASSLGFDAAPSLNGSRPEVAASGPAPMATDSGDWSYLEGRNIWIYDPAGEAPQRPPAALPRGAEPGGQWTYHEDREYWYYEPPAAAAGAGGGAQAEATGSAEAATVEPGATAGPSDVQSLIDRHVDEFLEAGGVLTSDQRQRLVELGVLEPGEAAPPLRETKTVPDAGATSDAADLFELNDSGSKPPGRLTREQGTGNWYNASTLEDDSGINLVGPGYNVMDENTIVADGTVKIGNSTARVQTTYTRNPDGTITTQSRIINYYQDDAPGGGGGGGDRNRRDYTVAADGTVSYTEGKSTYTVSDDALAQDVRDAAASGDAGALSTVDQATVSDDSGNVVATNFRQPESDDGGAAVSETAAVPSLSDVLQTLESGTVIDPGLARSMGLPMSVQTPDGSTVEVWGATVEHRKNEDGVTETALTTPVSEPIGPTTQPPTGLEAAEIGDLDQAQAESRIITAYQAEQYGDPSLAGQMRVEGRASDGSVTQAVVGQEFVEQARSYGLTPDQLYQGYVDDEESALHGAEGAAQPLAARAETAEFNRFRNEVVAAYAAPDVVDDEGFATSVNAHQHTRGTLEQTEIAVCG